MLEPTAICACCGAEKDLPLGRCPGCGHLPAGEEREVALVCSTRVLDVAALRTAQERIRRGEPVRPTAALRGRAREILSGVPIARTRLSAGQLLALATVNLVLTPLVGYAVWWWRRHDQGPAGKQALVVTIPCSILLFGGILAWRLRSIGG